jgi:hypothetical protein
MQQVLMDPKSQWQGRLNLRNKEQLRKFETMFQSKKNKLIPAGDYVTAEEVVINNQTDIKYRCETAESVVKDKILPLSQALKAYELSTEQYLGYLMLQPKKQKILVDNGTFAALMTAVLGFVDFPHSNLDDCSKKVVKGMRELSTVK